MVESSLRDFLENIREWWHSGGPANRQLILTILAALLLAIWLPFLTTAASIPSDTKADANQFWHQFRTALIKGQHEKIVGLTRFPFEVRGVVDGIPVKSYNRRNFQQVLNRVMKQPVLVPTDGHFRESTVLQEIKEKPELASQDYVKADFIRVEQLEFQRIRGKWLLTGAYLDE